MELMNFELQKQEWKFGRMRNFVGAQAIRRIFPQLLRVLLNFITQWKHREQVSRKYCNEKKENNLFTSIITVQIFFAHTIIMSTTPASSVNVSRNTGEEQ